MIHLSEEKSTKKRINLLKTAYGVKACGLWYFQIFCYVFDEHKVVLPA